MYVEPLQERDLLTSDLPDDGWADDQSLRDAVWLAAADLWLRRAFFSDREPLTRLEPTPADVRVAGACYDCTLFLPIHGPKAAPSPIFLFTGDLVKWADEQTDPGSVLPPVTPEVYQDLAARIAEQGIRQWDLDDISGDERHRFSRLQALLWSVQALRVNLEHGHGDASHAAGQVHEIADALGLAGPPTGRPGTAVRL